MRKYTNDQIRIPFKTHIEVTLSAKSKEQYPIIIYDERSKSRTSLVPNAAQLHRRDPAATPYRHHRIAARDSHRDEWPRRTAARRAS
eukprot:6187148-Pleurochrysis_carterae.AAC.3